MQLCILKHCKGRQLENHFMVEMDKQKIFHDVQIVQFVKHSFQYKVNYCITKLTLCYSFFGVFYDSKRTVKIADECLEIIL